MVLLSMQVLNHLEIGNLDGQIDWEEPLSVMTDSGGWHPRKRS
jgi:hypothetical protein